MAAAGLLAGCALVPAWTSANSPAAAAEPTRASRELDVARPPFGEGGAFVGIALSGGGSRAANFAAAVLFELGDLGVLRHAVAISSTSGGSLAAAYYGLHGAAPARWAPAAVRALFRTDFETRWIARWFLPHNVVRYWLTDFDRSDIMATVFDAVVFRGATFGAMGAPESGPRIFLNATDVTTWERFTFTDEALASRGSRLDTYPVAHAVMGSGAFPGAFANVTLRDYRARPRGYVHLLDGGPTDNLGLTPLLEAARELYRRPAGRQPSGCFLFVVDAYAATEYEERRVRLTRSGGDSASAHGARDRDTRGALDYFVDTNALAAANVLLYHHRVALLREAGIDGRRSWAEPVQQFPLFPDEPERVVT